jgi:hypothetical protein
MIRSSLDRQRRLVAGLVILATLAMAWLDAGRAQAQATEVYPLPSEWRGPATVPADGLAEAAPPLQAVVLEGDFQITYVPAETGDVLRVLPTSTGAPAALQIFWQVDAGEIEPNLADAATAALALEARLYAPGGAARAFIADDAGSSSTALDALSWTAYRVDRRLAADSAQAQFGIEWTGVSANSWLELRAMRVELLPTGTPAAAPTDTPTPPGTPTPIPTSAATPTATPAPLQEPPTPTPLPTPTPMATATLELIVVTSTPPPADIFEAATRVAMATEWAAVFGPATSTPENLATATPTLTPIVVVNTPTPGNAATATYVALYATAAAATTGTPTPFPPDAVVLAATATPVPPAPAPTPTRTPTPVFVLLDDIPTPAPVATEPLPEELLGKIVFLTDYRGNVRRPDAMVINPDGTGAGVMTGRLFYDRTNERDSYSADKRYRVYSLREAGGEAYNAGLIQLFYDDAFYNSTRHQLTYFGAGVAWAPVWSPARNVIALVSSESANDEIWLVEPGTWPAVQLTKNDWEWDHHPSFSPDGTKLVFSSNRVTGRRQLWIMDLSTGEAHQLTNFPFEAWDPVWVKYPDS